jgi:hypothetical protein
MMALRQIRTRAGPAAVLLAALSLCCSPAAAAADKQPSLEYQVKAAFLLNFTKFIEWPPSSLPPNAPFSICILGSDPFGRALDRIVDGETVNGRKLAVTRIHDQQSHSCQMVFVDRSEKEAAKVLPGFGRGVLTVGERNDFMRDGGMIAFVIENRRVRFDVNMAAAANAGLRISSKLLNVARSVEK